jgi:hypothetical protein
MICHSGILYQDVFLRKVTLARAEAVPSHGERGLSLMCCGRSRHTLVSMVLR